MASGPLFAHRRRSVPVTRADDGDAGAAPTAELDAIRVYPVKSLDGVAVDAARIGPDGGLVPDRTVALVDADGDYVNGKREPALHRIAADYDTTAGTVTLSVAERDGVGGSGTAGDSDTGDDPSASSDSDAGNDSEAESEASGPTAGTVPEPATFAVPGFDDGPGDATTPAGATTPTDASSADDTTVDGGPDELAAWVGEYLGYTVEAAVTEPSYPDDTTASGPTVVSRATLTTVAGWFDLTPAEVLRRFRANLVVAGRGESLPAFWEDRLYGDRSTLVSVAVGDATLYGEGPCRRCVVPTRDPDTGVETPAFQRRFVERRRETLPAWSEGPRFDGAFRLALNTVVPSETTGERLAVGDRVAVTGTVPATE